VLNGYLRPFYSIATDSVQLDHIGSDVDAVYDFFTWLIIIKVSAGTIGFCLAQHMNPFKQFSVCFEYLTCQICVAVLCESQSFRPERQSPSVHYIWKKEAARFPVIIIIIIYLFRRQSKTNRG